MLKAAIIGCGSIGALKPDRYDYPGRTEALTHAHAITRSSNIELVAVVDSDDKTVMMAGEKWGCIPYHVDQFSLMFYDCRPDIVVIATPTETHLEIIDKVTSYGTKLIVAEKPFCLNQYEAQAAHIISKGRGVPIVVNYSRRFLPMYQQTQRSIQENDLGSIQHARLLYGRGLLRDGCHGLDLFHWFFGPLLNSTVLGRVYDHEQNDPSIITNLRFEACPDVHLGVIDSQAYSIFEMDIVGKDERLLFTEHGGVCIRIEPRPEPVYGDYLSMPTGGLMQYTNIERALQYLYMNCVDYLLHGVPLLCTAEDAIRVHESIEKIKGG